MVQYVERTPQRVRFPLRFRQLRVVSVENLTPQMRRIVLEGNDLEGFESQGFDDHVKLFPQINGQPQTMPGADEDNNPVWPDPMPVGRDYTPRYYDAAQHRLTLDFAVGHGGPATVWAETAKAGDQIGIGGPRGSFLVPVDYAEHLLVGDETALPAIARRLEQLPAGVRAIVVVEVEDESGEMALDSQADVEQVWVHRNGQPRGEGSAMIEAAVAAAKKLDPVDTFVWAAAESAVARALRPALLKARDFNPKSMRVAAYWRINQNDTLEMIED